MKNHNENGKASESVAPNVSREGALFEGAEAHGRYHVECIGPDGELKWSDDFDNVVTTAGKNFALDTFLDGSAYTKTGPYIGLINTNASAAAASDTMSSHAGWLEVGAANAPTYKTPNAGGSAVRATAAWSGAANGEKQLSAAASFYIVTGTSVVVGGCFMVLGTGAVSTIDSGAGILYSAGAFTGGSKTVSAGDTLNVTYKASL